jgi:YlmC/YmxH family sporulation protein
MHLSELQTKEIINISNGQRLGIIVDVIVNVDGKIKSLILEEKKGTRRFSSKEEYELNWERIVKIGEDIILVEDKKLL